MRLLLLPIAVLLAGCPIDYCRFNGEPEVQIGLLQDGGWAAYEEGQPLDIQNAVAGGFGIDSDLRTAGLETGDFVDARLEVWVEGALEGRFSAVFPSACEASTWGAVVQGTFFLLDPGTYPDTQSVLALEGKPAELRVLVTDPEGNEGAAGLDVTLRL